VHGLVEYRARRDYSCSVCRQSPAYWASLGGRFSFDCRRGCIGASDPASDRCNTIASSGITPQWSRAPQAQLGFPRHGVSRRLLTPSVNRVIETDFQRTNLTPHPTDASFSSILWQTEVPDRF